MRETIDDIVSGVKRKIGDSTVNYCGDISNYESNRSRAIVGLIGLGVLTLMPGPQTVISYPLAAYTGIKSYQAVKDWCG